MYNDRPPGNPLLSHPLLAQPSHKFSTYNTFIKYNIKLKRVHKARNECMKIKKKIS